MRPRATGATLLMMVGCWCSGDVAWAQEERVSIATATTELRGTGGTREQTARRSRTRRDRGEMSMQLGDVEWKGTSARARVKERTGTLTLSGSRSDGDVRNRVRQSVELLLPDYDGPGAYTAATGSMFLVVGLKAAAATESEMDAALVETLARAEHVQLAGAKVVIESATDTELVGSFSFDRGEVQVTDGRFRALLRR